MKNTRWHSCNVLQNGADSRELWEFANSNGAVTLSSRQRLATSAPLPRRAVGKNWTTLWQKKLNIAWLPSGQVFLRVAQFPKCDPAELLSMVELQLEKYSPLPVNQIVWTVELLPGSSGDLQAVVIVIVERRVVEEFLGKLESAGYLADRLELPLLHQLIATRVDEDGVWIFLSPADDRMVCLLAWWFGGALQTLSLLSLPADETGPAILRDELDRIAWAGEFEGWLTSSPRFQLVADEKTRAEYHSALKAWAGDRIQAHPATEAPALAELSAQRSTDGESIANLLPVEYSARYHQQFFDRLWMRGLGALILVYVAGVLVYLAALQVRKYQKGRVDKDVAALKSAYTDAQQLKAKVRILQEQANLRFAALDCLKLVSEQLPSELTLKSFVLSGGGKKLSIRGESSADDRSKVTEFNAQLGSTVLHGAPFFTKVNPPSINPGGGGMSTWNFDCELRTPDTR